NLVYSQRNRSAACRIPLYSKSPKAKRVEFRCPDPACNPYIAFSAMLMAGLEGVQTRIAPPDPVDKDLYDLPPEELKQVPQVPASLDEALDALEADQDYLKAGGVFTDDLIETWINYKRLNEIDAVRLRPHPWEFMLYYDIWAYFDGLPVTPGGVGQTKSSQVVSCGPDLSSYARSFLQVFPTLFEFVPSGQVVLAQ